MEKLLVMFFRCRGCGDTIGGFLCPTRIKFQVLQGGHRELDVREIVPEQFEVYCSECAVLEPLRLSSGCCKCTKKIGVYSHIRRAQLFLSEGTSFVIEVDPLFALQPKPSWCSPQCTMYGNIPRRDADNPDIF